MTSLNEITGDLICSKSSEKYRDNYDRIFRKSTEVKPKCNHSFVPKLDLWCLICVKCGQQENV